MPTGISVWLLRFLAPASHVRLVGGQQIMKKYNWSQQRIEEAVKQNKCYNDVLRELGIPTIGRNADTLKRKIKEYNIDVSHFTFISKTKSQKLYKKSTEYLAKDSSISSYKLKEKLIKDGIKENKCEICGISEWQGKELVCQLHHINGDHHDNRLENLQLLCPNCHSQTDTYCGKSETKTHHCLDCGRVVTRPNSRCTSCAAKVRNSNRKSSIPDKETLEKLIHSKSFVEIGKMYNVSDNAVRKWCKSYNLPHLKSLLK